jgi:hypothetical protein
VAHFSVDGVAQFSSVVDTDDVIAAKLEPVLSNGMGPFRRVWLYGNGVQVLASNS